MPTYLIIHASMEDYPTFLDGYVPVATALVEKFGGRYLVRTRDSEVLEGAMGYRYVGRYFRVAG
jgi:uncharacterized protein (DUF1330 family)